MLERHQKVRIKKSAIGLSQEHRKFAGKDAIVLQVDGDLITLSVDHDNNPLTEPVIITVKNKNIEIISFLWSIWLSIRSIFGR